MDIILLIMPSGPFCNMTAIADGNFCVCFGGHWITILSINVSAGDDCPTGWNKALTIMLASVEHHVMLLVVSQYNSNCICPYALTLIAMRYG